MLLIVPSSSYLGILVTNHAMANKGEIQNEMEHESGQTKISDSAYSKSCSNSNSQSSASSKSVLSGSNSSGSSGYCGNDEISAILKNHQVPLNKRNKKSKIHALNTRDNLKNVSKVLPTSTTTYQQSSKLVQEGSSEHGHDALLHLKTLDLQPEPENDLNVTSDTETLKNNIKNDETLLEDTQSAQGNNDSLKNDLSDNIHEEIMKLQCSDGMDINDPQDGFSCIISMCDGVILYATPSLTTVLGFPEEMWLGRNFTDFIRPKDRDTFSNEITGVAIPFINGIKKRQVATSSLYVCLRKYSQLEYSAYKGRTTVSYQAFNLTVTYRHATEYKMGNSNDTFLLIVAVPVHSSYKVPNEIRKFQKFGMRHTAACMFTHVDADVVMNFGYLPQDMLGKSVFDFYHPEDLPFLKEMYESVISKCQISGSVYRSKPYRFAVHNGDFAMIETEWSSFINPWSRRLEFIVGLHKVLQGPRNPDVFEQSSDDIKHASDEVLKEAQSIREEILILLNKELLSPFGVVKQEVSKGKDLHTFMESTVDAASLTSLKINTSRDYDLSLSEFHERDSIMLGEISPHHEHDRGSSETPPSYNQLNYNENIARFFKSKPKTTASNQSGERKTSSLCIADRDQNVKDLMTVQPSNQKYLSPVQTSVASGRDSASVLSSVSNLAGSGTSTSISCSIYKPRLLTQKLLHRHDKDMEKIMRQHHRSQKSNNKVDRERKGDQLLIQGVKRTGSLLWKCDNPKMPRHENNIIHPNVNESTYLRNNGDSPFSSTNNGTNPYIANVFNDNLYQSKNVKVWPPLSTPVAHYNGASSSTFNNFTASGMVPFYYMPPQVHQNFPEDIPNPTMPFQVQYMPGMLYNYNPVFTQSSFLYPSMPMMPMSFAHPIAPSVPTYTEKIPVPCDSKSKPVSKFQGTASEATLVTAVPESMFRSMKPESAVNMAMSECSRKNIGLPSDCSPIRSIHNCGIRDTIKVSNKTNDNRLATNNNISHDESSSYSLYSSSFLKTDTHGSGSGSNTDSSSGIQKGDHCNDLYKKPRKHPVKKFDPPWMEAVSVTPDFVYCYQLPIKNLEAVLQSDLRALKNVDQPLLVNDQLDQLYVELELDGLSPRLILDEGITSSSSSGEDNFSNCARKIKKKKSYSSLMMMYDGDISFPPPKSF